MARQAAGTSLRSALGIEELAKYLGVPKSQLDRWHHLGWAACTEYEEVSVPRVGYVSARRWSAAGAAQLKENLPELLRLDADRKAVLGRARIFGRELARSRWADPNPDLLADPIAMEFRALPESSDGFPVGMKSAVQAMLREQHLWCCSTLNEEFGLAPDFASGCTMEVKWAQLSTHKLTWGANRSHGGMRNGKPWYKVEAANYISKSLAVSELGDMSKGGAKSEYAFINADREIGELECASPVDALFLAQLHEIAHAVQFWAEAAKFDLRPDLIEREGGLRLDDHAAPIDGHGVVWSAIYRALRQRAGLVAR